ncbi:MAG: hypothetical protein AAFW70_21795 [Cyanobacteria bacterium J06635_10]
MPLTNKAKNYLRSQFNQKLLPKFNEKVIPVIKREIRVDTGNLRDNVYAEIAISERLKVEGVRVVFDTKYAWILELRSGMFSNGNKLGARVEELAKLADD